METTKKRILLLDGTGLLYRAYYAMPDLRSRQGMPTGGIYGLILSIRNILQEFPSEHLVIAFDLAAPTKREEEYAEYKANRPEPPADLIKQIPKTKELLQAYGYLLAEYEGYEADDILATLAVQAEAQGYQVIIGSADKDMLQMVSPNILVYRTHHKHNKIYDVAAVKERYGVPPKAITDILALQGDSSDNIPGVPGIGEKTARNLVAQFNSLEEIIEQADNIKSQRYRNKILEYAEQARLSKKLASLEKNVPLNISLANTLIKPKNKAALIPLLKELDLHTFIREELEKTSINTEKQYQCITEEEQLKQLCEKLNHKTQLAIDTETDSLKPHQARLVGISLAWEKGCAAYIPLAHSGARQIPLLKVKEILGPIISSTEIKKIGHNIKFDLLSLRQAGFTLGGIDFDTLLAHFLLNTAAGKNDLKTLALIYLQMDMTSIDEFIGKSTPWSNMAQVPVEKVYPYACADADAAWQLYQIFAPQLKERGLWELFCNVEIPLIEVLAEMEWQGVSIDRNTLEKQSRELKLMLAQLTQEIYKVAGGEFNIRSPKQLAEILYDKLNLKSNGKKHSTKAEILENLAAQGHPLPALILEYRQIEKIRSTYIDALLPLINPITGKLHTSYRQTGTNTGRISSSEPNLQNIPVRTDLGKRVREAFIPSPGNILLSADYSQIELRILAHIAEEENMCAAFKRGEDIHSATAAELFNIPIEKVTPEQRAQAKTINFGLNYGMSPYGLSQRLGISVEEARAYMDLYFSRYPKIQEYIEKTTRQAEEHKMVKTIMNRQINLPDINSSNHNIKENNRRAAINAPIQGSAADLIKLAMIKVFLKIKQEKLAAQMILTVHDELIFDTKETALTSLKSLVKKEMENVYNLRVPLVVKFSQGNSWADL